MTSMQPLLTLVGRVLLAWMFLDSGYGKITNVAGTAGYIASVGLPMPQVLAIVAIIVELGAGIALVIGWKARWAALALGVFTAVAAFHFHNFWAMPADKQMLQEIMFLKNMAVTGGMLFVIAFGPGAWSVDRR